MAQKVLIKKRKTKEFKRKITPQKFAEKTLWQGCPIPLNRGLPALYNSIHRALGISEKDLRFGTRAIVNVHARLIFYVMIKEFYQLTPTEASKIWGKSHCNYLYALATHAKYVQSDKKHEYRYKFLNVFNLFVQQAVDPNSDSLPKTTLRTAFVNKKRNAKLKPKLESVLKSKFDNSVLKPTRQTRTIGTVTLEMIEQRLRTQGAQQGDLEKVLQSFKGKGIKFTELEVSLACNDLGVRYIQ